MSDQSPLPILVAVGDDPADQAIEYAAREALRAGCGLQLVHVVNIAPSGPELVTLDLSDVETIGRGTLEAARRRAEEVTQGRVPVSAELVNGPVVAGILEAAGGVREIVLQRRRLSGRRRAVTRSTSSGVAAHAHVPVVSVPDGWVAPNGDRRPVVTVGVDIPERCRGTLRTALAEARSRNATLRVLHTWWFPSVYNDIIMDRLEDEDWSRHAREELRRLLHEIDRERGGDLSDLSLRVVTRQAHAADALVEAARDSVLLVIGRHDPLIPLGSHLGPVARAVLREAECPVLLADPAAPHLVSAHGTTGDHHAPGPTIAV